MATETHRSVPRGATLAEASTMRRKHPEWTLQEIGTHLGVTREYIRLLLNRAGLPTVATRPPPPACGTCGAVLANKMRPKGRCAQCLTEDRHTYKNCDSCGKANRYQLTAIHRKNINPISGSRDTKHFFCNNTCQGKWAGTHYGLGSQLQIDRDSFSKGLAGRQARRQALIETITKAEFPFIGTGGRGKRQSPEHLAVKALETDAGFRTPCRWSHSEGRCSGQPLVRIAARRYGMKVHATCQDKVLHVLRYE